MALKRHLERIEQNAKLGVGVVSLVSAFMCNCVFTVSSSRLSMASDVGDGGSCHLDASNTWIGPRKGYRLTCIRTAAGSSEYALTNGAAHRSQHDVFALFLSNCCTTLFNTYQHGPGSCNRLRAEASNRTISAEVSPPGV